MSQSTSVDAKGEPAELALFFHVFQASEGKHEVSKEYEAHVMAKGLPLLPYDTCCNVISDGVFRLK